MKIYKKYEHLPINIAMQKSRVEYNKRKTNKAMKELKQELDVILPNDGESHIVTLVIKKDGGIELQEVHLGH